MTHIEYQAEVEHVRALGGLVTADVSIYRETAGHEPIEGAPPNLHESVTRRRLMHVVDLDPATGRATIRDWGASAADPIADLRKAIADIGAGITGPEIEAIANGLAKAGWRR